MTEEARGGGSGAASFELLRVAPIGWSVLAWAAPPIVSLAPRWGVPASAAPPSAACAPIGGAKGRVWAGGTNPFPPLWRGGADDAAAEVPE